MLRLIRHHRKLVDLRHEDDLEPAVRLAAFLGAVVPDRIELTVPGRREALRRHALLDPQVDDLHRAVDEVAAGLSRIDKRVDGCLSHTSIVRYDAYEDAGGHQSASLAFLDAARSGVVVSAIQGRDYARIYVKELDRGRASVALSPEEQQAVDRAMTY